MNRNFDVTYRVEHVVIHFDSLSSYNFRQKLKSKYVIEGRKYIDQ